MSRKLTTPMAEIPIGVVNVSGSRVDVKQHPEFTRFFLDLVDRVGGVEAWSNSDLMLTPQGGGASDELSARIENQRLQSEVADLREQIFELSKRDAEARLAQLEEQVYAGVYAMKRQRAINASLTLGVGVFSATYSISPAVVSLTVADLFYLGTSAAGGGVPSDHAITIEFTNTSTITARRSTSNVSAQVFFRIVEYTT